MLTQARHPAIRGEKGLTHELSCIYGDTLTRELIPHSLFLSVRKLGGKVRFRCV